MRRWSIETSLVSLRIPLTVKRPAKPKKIKANRKTKPYAWAWRLLPFEYRFALVCVHRLPKGHAERNEFARFLLRVRKQDHERR